MRTAYLVLTAGSPLFQSVIGIQIQTIVVFELFIHRNLQLCILRLFLEHFIPKYNILTSIKKQQTNRKLFLGLSNKYKISVLLMKLIDDVN